MPWIIPEIDDNATHLGPIRNSELHRLGTIGRLNKVVVGSFRKDNLGPLMLYSEEKRVIEMDRNKCIEKCFSLAFKEGMIPDPLGPGLYFNYIFKNVSFEDKSMLDIGGGAGLFSFYAACMGVDEAICIEPEAAGSTPGLVKKIDNIKAGLENGDRVFLETNTLQDFNPQGKTFDIILLHNSINHLNEDACIKLKYDAESVTIYKELFNKLNNLASPGALLIIADCSRYNIFPLLRIRNPFAPTIEWYKHQSPNFWINLLSGAGFSDPNVRWSIFNQRLRFLGKIPFVSGLVSYFRRSHFCLIMKKPL